MAGDRVRVEAKAWASYSRWIEEGDALREMFEEAGMPFPARLALFLGEASGAAGAVVEDADDGEEGGKVIVAFPRPQPPARPLDVDEDAIWVPLSSMTAQSLVLAMLREHGAKTPLDLHRLLAEIGRTAGDNVLWNVGRRLQQENRIDRSGGVWAISKPNEAPILAGGFGWGPAGIFSSQEIAAHRRLLVLHALTHAPKGGLIAAHLVASLREAKWAPKEMSFHKDVVKADLQELQHEGLIRRDPKTKRWELADVSRAGSGSNGRAASM